MQIFVENGNGDANLGNVRVGDQTARSKSPAKSFSYRELCVATGMFNSANKIGEGGFGKVFRGRLETGEVNFGLLAFTLVIILHYLKKLWKFKC